MHFDVAVFDFDGTLVQSAELKHRVFYEVFPAECASVIASILHAEPEASRYSVIPRIVAESRRLEIALAGGDTDDLVAKYADRAVAGVRTAPEVPGAERVLQTFFRSAAIYVSSATPQQQLQSLLANRGWTSFISGVYGYPNKKGETVAFLLKQHAIPPSRLLVIGDGESDRMAAEQNGCAFFHISQPTDLSRVISFAGVAYA
jgi:phosphoglycolate phosphatase-like HAD superfamily hydrolase